MSPATHPERRGSAKWNSEDRMPWPKDYRTAAVEPQKSATPLWSGIPATDGNRRKMPREARW